MKFAERKLVGIFLPHNQGHLKNDVRDACYQMVIVPLQEVEKATTDR